MQAKHDSNLTVLSLPNQVMFSCPRYPAFFRPWARTPSCLLHLYSSILISALTVVGRALTHLFSAIVVANTCFDSVCPFILPRRTKIRLCLYFTKLIGTEDTRDTHATDLIVADVATIVPVSNKSSPHNTLEEDGDSAFLDQSITLMFGPIQAVSQSRLALICAMSAKERASYHADSSIV
jgi:hypothetical protein